MALTILYFAWVRELVGMDQERVDVPADITTVRALASWLGRLSDGHRAAFSDLSRLRAAVDQAFVDFDSALEGGAREIAFFPPVTGG